MKVVMVLEHYYPYIGGAETLFQLIAESLVSEKHKVTVITTRFSKHLSKQEIHNGVKIVRINCANRFLFTLFSLPKVIQYANRADIIHTTTYNAALPAWLAAKITRRKVIVTFHEVWGKLWFKLPFASWLEKISFYCFEQFLLFLPFDQYIAVSDFTKNALVQEGIAVGKISHIYNGLNYDEFQPYQHQPPDVFTYTYFGRLGISKGLDLLLPAAKKVSQEHPKSRLVLVLPKRPVKIYQTILRLIEQLSLKEHIIIRHELSREELYEQICHSSCVVIPSYSEGFCFVAAETVALGVPIISSGQGALKEVVSGQVIEMEDMTTEGLYYALKKAISGSWKTKVIIQYTIQTSLNDYINVYRGMIKANNKN